ncbi:MAG: phage holin family protein [Lysobacter sp.]
MGASDAGGSQDRDRHSDEPRDSDEGFDALPPDLLEAMRQIGATGRASLGAAGDTANALRTLVVADVALARSALGRSLAFSGFAVAFGASAWLLLMATLVVFLSRQLGWPWSAALLVPALLSVLTTAIAGWFAMRYFEHTRLQATRRQLARLGIGELAEFMPDPESPVSARAASARRPSGNGRGEPAKDEQGIDVTPP